MIIIHLEFRFRCSWSWFLDTGPAQGSTLLLPSTFRLIPHSGPLCQCQNLGTWAITLLACRPWPWSLPCIDQGCGHVPRQCECRLDDDSTCLCGRPWRWSCIRRFAWTLWAFRSSTHGKCHTLRGSCCQNTCSWVQFGYNPISRHPLLWVRSSIPHIHHCRQI